MPGTHKARNIYQQNIYEYTRRREDYKKLYGIGNPRYQKAARNIYAKVASWKKCIKRIDARRQVMDVLKWRVYSFTGFSPKTDLDSRYLFYKWGMEHNISGVHLSKYLGYVGRWTAGRMRLRFTRSFPTNPRNRELWHRFKQYMEDKA